MITNMRMRSSMQLWRQVDDYTMHVQHKDRSILINYHHEIWSSQPEQPHPASSSQVVRPEIQGESVNPRFLHAVCDRPWMLKTYTTVHDSDDSRQFPRTWRKPNKLHQKVGISKCTYSESYACPMVCYLVDYVSFGKRPSGTYRFGYAIGYETSINMLETRLLAW